MYNTPLEHDIAIANHWVWPIDIPVSIKTPRHRIWEPYSYDGEEFWDDSKGNWRIDWSEQIDHNDRSYGEPARDVRWFPAPADFPGQGTGGIGVPVDWYQTMTEYGDEQTYGNGGLSYGHIRVNRYCSQNIKHRTVELINLFRKYIGLLGHKDACDEMIDIEIGGNMIESVKTAHEEATNSQVLAHINSYNCTLKNMIGPAAENYWFDDIKWGLRLTYMFREDSTNHAMAPQAQSVIRGALESVIDNQDLVYYADRHDPLLPTPGTEREIDTPLGSVGPWPFGLASCKIASAETDDETQGQLCADDMSTPPYVSKAPRNALVQYDPFSHGPGTLTGKKVYSIPLIERELSVLNTTLRSRKLSAFGTPAAAEEQAGKFWDGNQIIGPAGATADDRSVFNMLQDEILRSEEYAAIFDYTFPVQHYLGLNAMNTIMSVKKIGIGPYMYVGTRDILTSALLSAEDAIGANAVGYEDPQLASLGGDVGMFTDAQGKNFNPIKINIGALVVKLFLETPFLILKGLVEAFDPNISIIKKVLDILKIIIESLPDEAPECALAAECIGPHHPKWEGGQCKYDLDKKYRNIKKELQKILDDMPVPLMSVLMLPNMLPFGCGFPPPPFGIGIGPPLTPFGVAYLILGLWKDLNYPPHPDLTPDARNPTISNQFPEGFEVTCREKLLKYQEIAAVGAIDSDPPETDSD